MMKCEHNIHIIVKHIEIRFKHAFEPDVELHLRSLNNSIPMCHMVIHEISEILQVSSENGLILC